MDINSMGDHFDFANQYADYNGDIEGKVQFLKKLLVLKPSFSLKMAERSEA